MSGIIEKIKELKKRIDEEADNIAREKEANQYKKNFERRVKYYQESYEEYKAGKRKDVGSFSLSGEPIVNEDGELVGIKERDWEYMGHTIKGKEYLNKIKKQINIRFFFLCLNLEFFDKKHYIILLTKYISRTKRE